ncbi:hypothetical protein [Methylobacterium aerolatum]|uniref:Uncharacterized protein n=1 Tax=Methylobacterium aerolatum TaxID=418708 RepID=A0ABU0HUL8_9HYPH|nr:hypothetical protein [Methylobacterium aerolatum]MDQ0446027.1 hypothetical protein [Methylobacterium aerolatum]GJD35064.1 hypothetical protein FMGBMHLM_1971 [Methylobacterium aerolatum]
MPKPPAGAHSLTLPPPAIRMDAGGGERDVCGVDLGSLANVLGGILERRTQAGEWVEYDPACWQERAEKLSKEVNWLLGRVDECLAENGLDGGL